ncbi:hypothetical protein NDU88_008143 [Pleurodeles waltl]|uniref:Tumor necrosis factor receptor superfamily member 6 n=1 Tax=Pleurodeles waltl TaxID=8319 RepID=A0AAV7QTU5_PLEWA|nr:hypothetical protein NDU88_008143 [Pleurodeles waltl]
MTRLRRCLFLLTPFMLLIEAPHVNQESLRITPAGAKNIVKRQTACPDGEYYSGLHCCKLCATGTHKISDCAEEHGNPYCTSCKKGIEYDTDQECHRCTICDPGEGLETLQDCTAKENTKCQCIEGYFCNATSRCTHCEPCDKCENGKILEKCTRQKNTLCEENHRKRTTLLAAIVVTVLVLIVAAAAAVLYCRKEKNLQTSHPGNSKETAPLQHEQSVDLQEKYPDVDLTQHFADIAEILNLETTLSFVRKNCMTEPTIEQIKMDNHGQTTEQKVQLVRKWYEEHGKPGAFDELIRTLTKLGYRSSAEKILKQIVGR